MTFHLKLYLLQSKSTRFVIVDEFIRIYDECRYLTLFGSEKYDPIYNRIR